MKPKEEVEFVKELLEDVKGEARRIVVTEWHDLDHLYWEFDEFIDKIRCMCKEYLGIKED